LGGFGRLWEALGGYSPNYVLLLRLTIVHIWETWEGWEDILIKNLGGCDESSFTRFDMSGNTPPTPSLPKIKMWDFMWWNFFYYIYDWNKLKLFFFHVTWIMWLKIFLLYIWLKQNVDLPQTNGKCQVVTKNFFSHDMKQMERNFFYYIYDWNKMLTFHKQMESVKLWLKIFFLMTWNNMKFFYYIYDWNKMLTFHKQM
jgi:hypothetical protein